MQEYKSLDNYKNTLWRLYSIMKQIFSDNHIEFEDSNQAYVDFLSLHFWEHKVKEEAEALEINITEDIGEWKETSVAKVKNLAKTNKMF